MFDNRKIIYLDNASTTKMSNEVLKKTLDYYNKKFYNPSSIYSCSQKLHAEIEECREIIAKTLNAKKNEIFFTSCGSEADNWALKGITLAYKSKGKHNIIDKSAHHLGSDTIWANKDTRINNKWNYT